MKIIIISKYARALEDGQPTRQYFFAKHFSAIGNAVLLIKSRANLSQVTPQFDGLYRKTEEHGVSLVTLNGQTIASGFGLKRIISWVLFEFRLFRFFKEIKDFKPDVIVVSSLSILTFISAIYLKTRLKVPIVLEVRDIYPLTLVEVGGFSRCNPFVVFLGWIEKWGYEKADLIVSSLENCDKHIATVTKRPCRFKWIPTGYEEQFYQTVVDETPSLRKLQELKLQDKFLVAYAGTIGVANSIGTLLLAAKEIAKSNPRIHFVIIGEGPEKEKLQNEAKEISNLTFVGGVDKRYLPLHLAKCDLLVHIWQNLPIYRFGISPNKWIDYMRSARPILLAHSYQSKIFEAANCGWQIPAQDLSALTDKIIEISSISSEQLNQVGLKGRMYVAQLGYNQLAQSYLQQLEEVIALS